ncbi:MAG TPA: rhomboid family intramembrane serine protease [Caulobacteraceae bacterium]|jgi:membrane associated rhomboid family serine protease
MDETPPSPWAEAQAREPAFNAPWTILALCGGLVALYAVQSWVAPPEVWAQGYGVTPTALAGGRWQVLLTSLFLHGSWTHVVMNSVAALAFGPPVARLMGTGPRGAASFFGFYLVCGAISGLGFVLASPGDVAPVVGASGAISGLMGAASRLIQGRGHVGSLTGSTVLGMAGVWVVINVVLGLSGLTPGAAGMPVAWQAHIAGYAAGLLLIGPFARLAGQTAQISITQ